MAFDNRNLYIQVNAADPEYTQTFRGTDSWRGSGMRIAFDFLRNLTLRWDPRDRGDYELGFSCVNGAEQIIPYVYHTDAPLAIEQIDFKFQGEKESEQRYDITIPWRSMPSSDFGRMRWFGMDYRVDRPSRSMGRQTFMPQKYKIIIPDKSGLGFGAALLFNGAKRFPAGKTARAYIYLTARKSGKAELNVECGTRRSVWKGAFGTGENVLQIDIPGAALGDGTKKVSVKLAVNGRSFLNETLTLTVENPAKTAAELKKNCAVGKEKAARLRKLIAEAAKGDMQPRKQIATAAIAELFLNRYIPEDIAEKRPELALRESRQVLELLDTALADFAQKRIVLSPVISADGARVEDGKIVNESGKALFLLSHHYISSLKHLGAKAWEELCINFDNRGSAPHDFMRSPGTADKPLPLPAADRSPKDLRNHRDRSYVDSNLILNNFWPAWFTRLYPDAKMPGAFFPADPDHPKVREFLVKTLGWAFKCYATKDAERLGRVLYFDLHNEPGFDSYTKYTAGKFTAYLKQRYKTLEELNRIWKTKFGSFEEIGKPHAYFNQAPVARYDWNSFNNDRFYQHFAALRNAVRENSGDKKFNLTFKLTNFSSWTPAYQPRGYDRERLMELTDLQGGDIGDFNGFDGPYSAKWRVQSLTLDLCRSLAPEQPVVDSEYHMFPDGYDRMRSMLWLGAYQGLNGTSLWCAARSKKIWFWAPGARESGLTHFYDSVDTKPDSFAGYTHAGVEIQRHADRLPLFYKGERPVALYYSQNSLNFEPVYHLSVLEAAYQAFFFYGVNLGFVTERMLLKDKIVPQGVKLLIVPNARYCDRETLANFRELEKKGVKILLIGDENLTRDTFDRLHTEKLALANPLYWNLPKQFESSYSAVSLPPEAWRRSVPEIMGKAGISLPVAVKGKNTDYVVKRFAVDPASGETIGYALNLGKKSAEFEFTGKDGKVRQYRDLDSPDDTPRTKVRLEPLKNLNFQLVSGK